MAITFNQVCNVGYTKMMNTFNKNKRATIDPSSLFIFYPTTTSRNINIVIGLWVVFRVPFNNSMGYFLVVFKQLSKMLDLNFCVWAIAYTGVCNRHFSFSFDLDAFE